jgi:ABC-type polysaccharide/polyol phosphate export permease
MKRPTSYTRLQYLRFQSLSFLKNSFIWLDLLEAMTKRELVVRYKRTELGFIWIVVTPIFQMLVIGLIFQHLLSNSIQNYFLYLLSGLLAWNYFSQTVLKNTQAIVNERHMIKKSRFPREIIVISISLAHLVHFIVGLTLLLVVSIVNGVQTNIFHLVLGIILLFVTTIGLSLLTSAINVRFRDTSFGVSILLQLLFYSTPIIYSNNQLPVNIKSIVDANPLSYIVSFFQLALSGNSQNISTFNATIAIVVSLTLLLLGTLVFKMKSRSFDDWL